MANPGPQASGDRLRGVLWAMGSATGAGAFMIPWKIATEHGQESDAVLVLLFAAALLNTLIFPMTGWKRTKGNLRTTLVLSAVLAVFTLVGNEASAAAIARISAPLLSVLQRAEVVIVALLAWVALRERANLAFWAGTLVAILGIFLLYGQAPSVDHVDGVVYGLISAAAFALMIVITRRWIQLVDAITVNGLRLWLSVGCWMLLHRTLPRLDQVSLRFVALVALAAAFGPFLGRLCMMQSLRYVEARIPALLLLTTPALTLALSWVILGSIPAREELMAGALILAGVALPVFIETRRVETRD